ncbi:MAG: hypothetical protein KGJ64_07100, partial [Betaproteobacteria bacterium]|nr:hypothetical protein [Betaproteobacteria bacterium]
MARAAADSTEQEKRTFAETDEAVQSVLARLREIAELQGRAAATLRAEGEQVQQEVAHVMVALQFGDRVSQILEHAASSLQELSRDLAEGLHGALGGDDALARIAAGYTTEEQRLTHEGQQAGSESGEADITFF